MLVEPLASLAQKIAAGVSRSCHFSDRKCGHAFTVYPDGRVTGCDELPMPGAALGHTGEGTCFTSMLGDRRMPLHGQLDALLKACSACPYESSCGGGCLATRQRFAGTPQAEAYCAYRARLIDHVRRDVRPSYRAGEAVHA
jgi:uncharacterized protein